MSVGAVGWSAGVNGISILSKSFQGVKFDSAGNSYTLLYTDNSTGTMRIINPDGSVATTVSVSAAFANFIIKRNSSGNYVGHFYVTGSANESIIPNAIEIDSEDSLYLIGFRFGLTTLTVGSSLSATTTTLPKPITDYQGYFIKWNSSGAPVFAMNPMSSRGSAAWGMRAAGSNIYLVCNVGVVENTNVLNADGTTFRTITAGSTDQGLIIKYSLSGTVAWAFRCSFGNGAFRPLGIDLDAGGNIYVGGRIMSNGTYTLYNLSGTNSETSSGATISVSAAVAGFLLAFNSSGVLQWRMVIDGTGTSQGNYETEQVFFMRLVGSHIYIPIISNSTAITTVLNGSQTSSTSTQNQSSVLLKIGTNGAFAWAAKATAPSTANYALFDSVAVDENNNVYASGSFNAASCVLTDSANSTTTVTLLGSAADGFVMWLNSSGVYQRYNQLTNVNPGDSGAPWTSARQPEINYLNGRLVINAQVATTTTIYDTSGASSATFSRNASEAYVVSQSGINIYTVPGAPTSVSAVEGNGQATVSFTAPASTGGSTITSYTVTSSPGGFTASGSSSPITVTGLTNGTAYTFTVTATNAAGTGAASSASVAVTPRTVPGAPTSVSAVEGNGQATVSFTAPASNGGSAITGYTVTSSPGGFTASGSSSPITVTGLTNGTAYTFTVTATNAAGTGAASSASASVTPRTVPGAPKITGVVDGSGEATVFFTAPESDGGSAITSYTVTSSPGNITVTSSFLSVVVSGLTNGTAYTFTVTATNAAGTGAASAASSSVIPKTVPGAPTGVSAVAGNGQATVSFTAPASDGGSVITGYRVTASPGGAYMDGSSSPITVTGLTNGTAYTFTVTATNVTGTGPSSSASSSITPIAPIVTYSVTYNLNGGTGTVPSDLTSYGAGDSVSLAGQSGFSRANHSFAGWSTSPSGSVLSGFLTMPATNTTLYARWTVTASFSGAPTVSVTGSNQISASWTFNGTAPQSFAIEWKDASNNTGVVNPGVAANLSSITTAAPTGTFTFRMRATLDATASVTSAYSSPAQTIVSALAAITTGKQADVSAAVSNIIVAETGANLASQLLSNPILVAAATSQITGAAAPTISVVATTVTASESLTTEQKVEKLAETLAAVAEVKGAETTVLAAAQALAANAGNTIVKDTTITALASAGIGVSAPISLSVASAEELKQAIPNVSPELNTSKLSVQVSTGATPIQAPETPGAAIYAMIPPNTTVFVTTTTGSVTVSYNPSSNSLVVDDAPKTVGDSIAIGDSLYIIRSKGTFTFEYYNNQNNQAICFLGNAPVLTPSGYKRIDSLAVGDLVRTADGRDVAIQRVKHQRVVAPSAAVNPYVIPKGQFGATENLAISPRHCVAVPGRGMVEARELGLRQLSLKAAFDYYNLELPEWDNMVVAGVEVESLAPKKRVVITAAQFRELVGGRSLTAAQLSNIARLLEDGSVELTLSRKARRT